MFKCSHEPEDVEVIAFWPDDDDRRFDEWTFECHVCGLVFDLSRYELDPAYWQEDEAA